MQLTVYYAQENVALGNLQINESNMLTWQNNNWCLMQNNEESLLAEP